MTHLVDSQVSLPVIRPGNESVFHLFVIQVERRQELLSHLASKGIQAGVHYPVSVHLQPAYKGRVSIASDMSVTTSLTDRIVSLPMYPELSLQDVVKITNAVKSFFKE
jgi:dTDP-4-amino-4,6-dideoxygalactose transaminase